MKRAIGLFLILLLVTSCSSRQDKVLASVGKYESKQMWTHGEFQDYTDFGIYTFSSVDWNGNAYFSVVTEEDIETVDSFVDDFENLLDTIKGNAPGDELALHYSFDRAMVDVGDYFYIYEDKNYPKYACYDLWIFDSQTGCLYYFHNNI